jgi:hypothetical protein
MNAEEMARLVVAPEEAIGMARAIGRLTNALAVVEAQLAQAQTEAARLRERVENGYDHVDAMSPP